MNWITEHYIEVTAAILGITGVFLTTRQNIWCWPIGLLNVTLSIYVFFIEKLYADVILQFFYLGMTLYGWYNWIFGGKKKYELPVRRIKGREVSVMLIIGIIFSFAMGYIIANYTDAAYPYWDSNL
ncbi:MAG: nicotinamide riboside transporter PnuC, partial [Bacteroidales bacterium]|nr:nicotinamide riboside transporter PnuC [Bacteroidales bacterium]